MTANRPIYRRRTSMRFRVLLISILATVTVATGLAAPAHATERAKVSLQECINHHDFTEFFRNSSGTDKYCYDSGGDSVNPLYVGLDHVTWFHAGRNSGWFTFLDG